ncbi:response regulator (plasmid) [Haloferax mediterranei ATCC 33500]|uniref:DNA-binding protein n=1 Tax=Haloferax mediterranei (strain ATCC 33500 / DSM 1411 / JCM 8866 / NBRC 14739 / NCIMB 2177 / R-4) TaxID=523841 RepID=I3R9V3_HALMT|nr:bacterio-opsin activator domain-containing protein [Haloferax mediterranei]AFK21013.1 putative DNA binding protein [Haloferax mediterranei ATCC 33500]AHZ24125.1 DNA-binding protein [Haloferax mediterranei ATCC 33500]EMA05201.1 putative DNA binding protein [Haloferax mediterranei ATCC 33500]MDX5989994.1 bacterio-opsin activator domain-containing protein [Haloferax mediterranei ATCC 33500]QCQ77177.1 response regulator [Haloferax mediterranei ATCC 33500]
MQDENTFRILLIDQDPDDARFITHYLKKAQLRGVAETASVTHDETLAEGMKHLSEDTHDLVMVALDLPGSEGLETVHQVASQAPALPIIVLAERRERETAIEATEIGAQDYLFKDSLGLDQLMRSIRYAVERKEHETELARQQDELEIRDRIETLIRDINTSLVDVSNHSEIEQTICERVAAAPSYDFAVVGKFATDTGQFMPVAWAGCEKHELDTAIDATERLYEQKPLATANRTQGVQFAQDLAERSTAVSEGYKTSDDQFRGVVAVPLVFGSTIHGILTLSVNRSHAFDKQELDAFNELGEVIGLWITAAERKEREQILTTLHHTTRQLLHTETKSDVAELVVNTSRVVLNLSHVAIYCIDDTNNILEPIAATPELAGCDIENQSVGPDTNNSVIWDVFVSGDTTVVDNLQAVESTFEMAQCTDAESGLFLPIGDRGVLVTLCSSVESFDTHTRKLVDMLAATAEAAFERIDHEMDLHERDQKLKEQNWKLTRLNWINKIIREIDQVLIQASSREEIEEAVCEKLHESGGFPFAWIGEQDPVTGSINPRAWVTEGSDYLDQVSFGIDESIEPTVQTMKSGTVTVVPNIAESLRSEPWRQKALNSGYQSVISLPLEYQDVRYGVLTVYANQQSAFDELVKDVLKELGCTVAHTINAIQRKRGTMSNEVTEIKLVVHEPDSVLNRIARKADTQVEFEAIIPQSGNKSRVLFNVTTDSIEDILSFADESVSVESITHVRQNGDKHLFEATVTGSIIAEPLINYGAFPQEITADQSAIHIVIELPRFADVREIVELLENNYGETELLSRRDRERSRKTTQEFSTSLEEQLTERQYEVLRTAYESGFFEEPRDTTGQEVANLIGISQSTFNHHLRGAERKLFTSLFGDQ